MVLGIICVALTVTVDLSCQQRHLYRTTYRTVLILFSTRSSPCSVSLESADAGRAAMITAWWILPVVGYGGTALM